MSKGETMESSPTPLTSRLLECSAGVPPAGENPALAGGVPNAVVIVPRFARRALLVRAGIFVFARVAPVLTSRTLLRFLLKATVLGGTPALQKTGLKSGFEMILESPSPSIHGDASSTPTALPARAKEKAKHGVANLERFARFSTQRVLNFSPRLKTPQKTREPEFGTHCVPNFRCCLLAASCGLTEKMNYRKAKVWNQPN
jgi:hypothetical protein